ncbi:cytosolic Fe-S cluster assembly factor Nbp35p [[Candida] anglica]|uniref:Cytosolic Fe-S cluster assembly factor Nbp35p n=1 Tax=[Candida] anglica TaxID=148631 RepID=A0ABP0EA18_9ASCO
MLSRSSLRCITRAANCQFKSIAAFHSSGKTSHENPLGLPRHLKNSAKLSRDGSAGAPPTGTVRPGGAMGRGLPIKQKIPGVKKIILVSSAKGGVGKSTVSVNLAAAIKQLGHTVGLLDADIFGPSVPQLLSLSGEPRLSSTGKLIPLSNYGIESMSMGYLIPSENSPIAWRGLMVMKALQQLLFEVDWSHGGVAGSSLDYLVIDMPPGTGDTQLTISQQLKVDGAVIVSTPQDIALIDAIKGIAMFQKVSIPLLGMVQNMSYFSCPNCHHDTHIFGSEGVQREAKNHNLTVLGSIPLQEDICRQSDRGKPVVISHEGLPLAEPYMNVARNVLAKLEK